MRPLGNRAGLCRAAAAAEPKVNAETEEQNIGSGNVVESNWDEVIDNFDNMELREELLRGIYAYGFEKPSAIQQRGIRPILLNHDTIAQAQSGTGKTATFAISSLVFASAQIPKGERSL